MKTEHHLVSDYAHRGLGGGLYPKVWTRPDTHQQNPQSWVKWPSCLVSARDSKKLRKKISDRNIGVEARRWYDSVTVWPVSQATPAASLMPDVLNLLTTALALRYGTPSLWGIMISTTRETRVTSFKSSLDWRRVSRLSATGRLRRWEGPLWLTNQLPSP